MNLLGLAAVGRIDRLDWLYLAYAATSQPSGMAAWQQGLAPASTVEITGTTVRVRSAGGGLEIVTTYEVAAGEPWITATSVFTNPGATSTWWLGDAMGHGRRSGVAGHGTLATPHSSPAAYLTMGRWIGMTGSDAQTYGLVYANTGFTAYGNGNWLQSQHEVTIPAGGEWTLTRRVTALPAATADPWAPLANLDAYLAR